MEFSKRLDLFGDEIFSALNQRKVALEAQGRTLFNLSVGTPDFEAPAHVKQALMDAATGSTACGTCRSCWTPCAATTSGGSAWPSRRIR